MCESAFRFVCSSALVSPLLLWVEVVLLPRVVSKHRRPSPECNTCKNIKAMRHSNLHRTVIFTVRNVVIILFTGGGGGVYPSMHSADTPWADTPQAQCMLGYTNLPPPPRGHCSGRYASYWNAFLFIGMYIVSLVYFNSIFLGHLSLTTVFSYNFSSGLTKQVRLYLWLDCTNLLNLTAVKLRSSFRMNFSASNLQQTWTDKFYWKVL